MSRPAFSIVTAIVVFFAQSLPRGSGSRKSRRAKEPYAARRAAARRRTNASRWADTRAAAFRAPTRPFTLTADFDAVNKDRDPQFETFSRNADGHRRGRIDSIPVR